jgi:hypothetical protein
MDKGTSKTLQAAEAAKAYRWLISRVADSEPRLGFCGAQDLPALLRPDVEVVLAHRPQDVLDNLEVEADWLKAGFGSPLNIVFLGTRLAAEVERACRETIWLDVDQECSERAVERERDDMDRTRAGGALRAEYV